jgi:hypothetical protein
MKEQYCDTNSKVVLLMIERLSMPERLPLDFKILEPQSGNGVIIELLPITKNKIPDHVEFCELNARKATVTAEKTGAIMREFDFMKLSLTCQYDRVISVPPFDNWKPHVFKTYQHVKEGGKMVVLLPVECMLEPDFINFCLENKANYTRTDLCACDYQCDTGILEISK